MKNNTQEKLISIINESLKTLGLQDFITYLDIPSSSAFGDYSTNVAFRLSKSLKKTHLEVAGLIRDQIEKKLEQSPIGKYIKEVKVEGAGFINF